MIHEKSAAGPRPAPRLGTLSAAGRQSSPLAGPHPHSRCSSTSLVAAAAGATDAGGRFFRASRPGLRSDARLAHSRRDVHVAARAAAFCLQTRFRTSVTCGPRGLLSRTTAHRSCYSKVKSALTWRGSRRASVRSRVPSPALARCNWARSTRLNVSRGRYQRCLPIAVVGIFSRRIHGVREV